MVIDKSNTKQVLLDFPKQCREALTLAKGIKVNGDFDKIMVCGMGGSGIGGDLLRAYMLEISDLPVYVIKDYDIPLFIDAFLPDGKVSSCIIHELVILKT